jgi:hypothetical protein
VTPLQNVPTGQLVQQFRDTLLALGRDTSNTVLSRQADLLEEEVCRRMAW